MTAETRSPTPAADPGSLRARLRRAAWLTLPCVLMTVLIAGLVIAGELGDHTQQIVYGYVAGLLFLFLSAPMHLVLGAVAMILAYRSRDRRGRWIHLYFVAWLVVHGVFLVAHGFHEPAVEAARRWVHRVTHPGEVSLLRLVQSDAVADPDELKALLDAGADPNARDRMFGRPAIAWAAQKGRPSEVELLLAAGADPNAPGGSWWEPDPMVKVERPTPIVMAAWARSGDRVGILRLLLGAGADARGEALLGTCRRGDIEAFRLLVGEGLDPGFQTDDGHACLHLSTVGGHVAMLRELLGHGEEVKDRRGTMALGYAARSAGHHDERYLETTVLLLDHGAIPSPRTAERLRELANSDETDPKKQRLRELLDRVSGDTASGGRLDR